MEEFLTHILAVYALTYAVMNGKAYIITDHLQRWEFFRSMFVCSLCTGTEIGWWSYFAAHIWEWPSYSLIDNFLFGLACGAVCLVIDRFLSALDTDDHG